MNKPSSLVDSAWPSMGYSRYTYNDTQIIAAVYGPYESRFSQKSDFQSAIIDVVLSDCLFSIDTSSHEQILKTFFSSIIDTSKYPYLSIMLNFQILSHGCNLLSSCMNAGLEALKFSNIELKTEFLAREYSISSSQIALAIVPKTDMILFSFCKVPLSFSDYKKCVEDLYKESLNLI
ncbi:unnamed protein product [Blepharisma stoltei]|uniref:Exoribonuclease phosphorolytic domain-containing protein n=1 Tax=Blepharisma stoltei TaxID=1481888 RepID=A0AAU9JCU1_9CILI|nr:unnamed protein product [Blepharisma stoltei]